MGVTNICAQFILDGKVFIQQYIREGWLNIHYIGLKICTNDNVLFQSLKTFFWGLDISPLSQSGSQVGGGKVAIFKSVTCRSAKSKPPNFYNENWEEDPMQWGCRIGWFLFIGVIDPIYQCCITKKTFKNVVALLRANYILVNNDC